MKFLLKNSILELTDTVRNYYAISFHKIFNLFITMNLNFKLFFHIFAVISLLILFIEKLYENIKSQKSQGDAQYLFIYVKKLYKYFVGVGPRTSSFNTCLLFFKCI